MLGFLSVFHIPIDELENKLGFLAIAVLHSPLGQLAITLLGFQYVFDIPIDELQGKKKKTYGFLPLPSYTPPGAGGLSLARILVCFSMPS